MYVVVENGGTLSGGFSENKLQSYTGLVADVTENTNGLKIAVKKCRWKLLLLCKNNRK